MGRTGGKLPALEFLALCAGLANYLASKRMACTGTYCNLLCQFCIATMMLGIYFFGFKVGHSPFVLLRNEGILDNAPFLHDAAGNLSQDYVAKLYQSGGSGLNALLQNYWMVIHPPILFLGFASTIVPFAFAYAGLKQES